MGLDVYGRIELRDPVRRWDEAPGSGKWLPGLDLDPLYACREYDAFAALFGVRNEACWEPVAGGRGCPSDATAEFMTPYREFHGGDDTRAATWVTWAELRDLDPSVTPARGWLSWDPPYEGPDADRRRGHGLDEEMSLWVDSAWPEDLVARYGVPPVGPTPAGLGSTTWMAGGAQFSFERPTRGEALSGGWQPVFNVMRALAERFGADGVRLVVHFV